METREQKTMDSREQIFYVCFSYAKNTQQMRFTLQELLSFYKKSSEIQNICPNVWNHIYNFNIYRIIDELFHVNYITKTKYQGVKPLYISFTREQYTYAIQYFTYLRELGVLK